jgi:hypothetical protein
MDLLPPLDGVVAEHEAFGGATTFRIERVVG